MSQNPYQPPFGAFAEKPMPFAPPAPRHSGLGIASFVMSLFCGIVMFALIGVATYLAASMQDEFTDESPQAIMVGLGIIGGLGLAVIGLGLGIAGVVQPNRNKLFAILGLIFNFLVLVSVCGIMALGLAVS